MSDSVSDDEPIGNPDLPELVQTRCGYIAIVGRPNVGKSTLMNRILGQKLSITSRRPQTTRHQVLGIKTEGDCQFIYVDTPGIHKAGSKAINRYMNRAAISAVKDVDVVVFLVDRNRWTDEDELVLEKLQHLKCPLILAINKVDRMADKQALFPVMEDLMARTQCSELVPVAALHGTHVEELEAAIAKYLPRSIHFFPEDQVTDRSQRFFAAELVREKIMRQLGDELPYEMTVEIEDFAVEGHVLHIHALILVERQSQKRIVIGDKGSRIRTIGTEARKDMEDMFGCKVMLNLWVKVKGGWSDDERALQSLGYFDPDS